MVKKVTTKTITKTVHEEDEHKKKKKKSHSKKKSSTRKKTSTRKKSHHTKKDSTPREPKKKGMSASEREQLLIENFVGLQHAMTNLSIKFGTLSDNISELLRIFESAAKSFAQSGNVDNSDMLRKIDSLLNQNKTIAKGLVLMESKLRGTGMPPQNQESFQQTFQQPTSFQHSSFERPRPKPLPSL